MLTLMATAAAPPPKLLGLRLSMSRLSLLVDLASLLAREVDFDALLATACERLAKALRADRATIWLVDAERTRYQLAVVFQGGWRIVGEHAGGAGAARGARVWQREDSVRWTGITTQTPR